MFVGRENELESLRLLLDKRTSSLVACRGHRRIGAVETHQLAEQKFANSPNKNSPTRRTVDVVRQKMI